MSALRSPKLILLACLLFAAVLVYGQASRQTMEADSENENPRRSNAEAARTAAEQRLREAWDGLTLAEQNFAAQSLELGKIRALLNHFADDAIVFHRRGPVDARAVYAAGDTGDTAQLISRSHYNDVSLAGDIGLTAGPYQHLSDDSGSGDRTQGHIIGVWRKIDGHWRLAADMAVRIPGVLSLDVEPDFEDTRQVLAESSIDDLSDRYSFDDLREADSNFARSINFQGGRRAMRRYGLEHQRVYLPGMAPAIGNAAGGRVYGAFLDDRLAMDTISIETLGGAVAASGDVSYTYGTMTAENAAFRTSYLRFWRADVEGAWKIVVEVLSPYTAPTIAK